MPVALVTGAGGFLGRYVCRELSARGVDVLRLSRKTTAEPGLLTISDAPTAAELTGILDAARPDVVYHLAGTSSMTDLAALYQVNVLFAEALLQGAMASRKQPKVLLVGSAAEYGKPTHADMIVHETDPCRPVSAYGISKLAQTLHGLAAPEKGLDVTVARLFNPIGLGSPPTTALGNFVRQLARMDSDGGVLRTGSLEAVRDFIAVEEAARLIVELPSAVGTSGRIFNLCTGQGTRLHDIVSQLIEVSGLAVTHEIEEGRRGTSDLDKVVGSNARLNEIGLTVAVPDFRGILADMLAAERATWRQTGP